MQGCSNTSNMVCALFINLFRADCKEDFPSNLNRKSKMLQYAGAITLKQVWHINLNTLVWGLCSFYVCCWFYVPLNTELDNGMCTPLGPWQNGERAKDALVEWKNLRHTSNLLIHSNSCFPLPRPPHCRRRGGREVLARKLCTHTHVQKNITNVIKI